MSSTDTPLSQLQEWVRRRGGGVYLGRAGDGGLAFADPEQALLILGPPRSGKTTSLVVPNVFLAPGPVISTSTKPDVLTVTVGRRQESGRCWLFDPTGTVRPPAGVTPIRWSPVCAATTWDESLAASRAMVGAARPHARMGEAAHWTERAEALLAPLLHAAAVSGGDMRLVARWVLRQDLQEAAAILAGRESPIAVDVLAGVDATEGREQSGIWSTAAGVLAAYRSDAALASADAPNFDPARLVDTSDTVYVCAAARDQELVAPIVVAFLESARAGAYRAAAQTGPALPLTLVLDELANIAPLPDLPALVSEGGGQGVVTVAALQDLSQARERWGRAADGFLTLFGAKVVLPGIGDLPTLELVSRLAGEHDVPVRSVSRSPWWSPGRGAPTVTWSTQRRRRLPVDQVNQLPRGTAMVLSGARPPERVWLPPWWDNPWLRPAADRHLGRTRPARPTPTLGL